MVGGTPFHGCQFVADMALLFSLGTYGAENSPDGNPHEHFWVSALRCSDDLISRKLRSRAGVKSTVAIQRFDKDGTGMVSKAERAEALMVRTCTPAPLWSLSSRGFSPRKRQRDLLVDMLHMLSPSQAWQAHQLCPSR